MPTETAPAPAAAPAIQAPARPAAPGQPARTSPQRAPAQNLNDAFSQLDAMGQDPEPEPSHEQRPAPREQQQRQENPAANKPAEQSPAPEQKTEAKPGETGFPDPDKARSMRAGELSRHYKALKVAFDQLQKEKVELSSRPVDTEKLTRLENEAKENATRWEKAQEELRFTRYEKSQEYQDKYWKPYEAAYKAGAAKVSSLTVVPRTDPDTGEVTQEARPATAQDFNDLMQIMDDNKAAEVADQLFGSKASLVLMAREKALDLNNARTTALEEYRAKGGEIERVRAENTTKIAKEIDGIFENEIKTAAEKYPIWFKPVEGDDRGNELLQKSTEFVDSTYKGEFRDAEGNLVKFTPQEKAKRHSAIRNKAAAFDRIVYRNQNLLKELAAIRKKLEGYEASEPGGQPARRAAKTATGSSMDQALAKLGA